MDGGLPRGSQPTDRRIVSRQEPAYRQPEEPQQAPEPPRALRPSSSHQGRPPRERRSNKGLVWGLPIAAVVVVLALVGWFIFTNTKVEPTGIDTSRYQAVFLSNGQVYFGKLENYSDNSFKISKAYYPQTQTTEDDEEKTTSQSNIQLIRLGEEVHGPDNEMFILKDQIIYYENLKSDSKVSQLIEQNEKQAK